MMIISRSSTCNGRFSFSVMSTMAQKNPFHRLTA